MKGGPQTSGQSVRLWHGLRRFLRSPREGGFTIIEVMIVLVVSGALFVSAAVLISGRQNQTAFDQAIRQVQSQVQQALNEVAVGYYPNSSNFECEAVGGFPELTPGSSAQGTNSNCIFLGKALQFQVGTAKPEQFTTFTITALQQICSSSVESTCINQANPAVVAPSTLHNGANYPNNSVTQGLQSGLTTARMWYNNGGADVPISAIAFTNSLTRSSAGSVVTGSGQVNVIPVDGTTLGASNLAVAQAMNGDGGDALATSPINPSGGVFICFASGGTNQFGIIRIGGDNRSLAVNLTIKNKNGAAPCTYP